MRILPPEWFARRDAHAPPQDMPSPTAEDDARVALLVAQITERLRPVCAGWDEVRFQALVQRIACLKAHWGDTSRDH